jgi:hypothetical protein
MKQFFVVFLAGGWLLWSACGSPVKPPKTAPDADSLARKDSMSNAFFPVGDYLMTEILRVDSLPVAILRYTIQKGRKDSAFISPAEFNTLAKEFVVTEFRDGSFEKNYQESSFMDKTTRQSTFTYSTVNRDLPLQRVDVLVAPGAARNGSNEVKSIYLEKAFISGDTATLKKMFWKAGRNFQIITRVNIHGKTSFEQQLKVVWDSGEEEE